ncbi:MAG: glycosyltransferase family 2 protein [Gemmatimonadaceae bacterium]
MNPRRISVAIPIYNEEAVLPDLLGRLTAVLDAQPGGPHEIVFVNDGSRDRTKALLEEAATRDHRIVVINLSRNFGHQAALSAALGHVTGDVTLTMDADLQDAPEALSPLLTKLDEGYDVVVVRRVERKESIWKRAAYFLAYRLIARLSNIPQELDAGDFALMTRRVVTALTSLPERERYLRGLRSWVGFRQTAVMMPRAARAAGTSKYSLGRLVGLALDGAFSFSVVPLRISAAIGFLSFLGALLFSIYAVYARVVLDRSPQGFTALLVAGTFFAGILLIVLWILGEYVGRIYVEVKRRPAYLVESVIRHAPPRENG